MFRATKTTRFVARRFIETIRFKGERFNHYGYGDLGPSKNNID